MNKFPVTSSVVYPDYDNTPTYTSSQIVSKPSHEDSIFQKPTDSLIKHPNNAIYPSNPTPFLSEQTNDRNGPQKAKLGWIDESNEINYPEKPTESFGQQPDVLNCVPKPLNDVIRKDSPRHTKPTVTFAEQFNDINYPPKPTVCFIEQSSDINPPMQPSVGFVDQSNVINSPKKPPINLVEQPNDIDSILTPIVGFVEETNAKNSPHKNSSSVVEQPNDVDYILKPIVGFVEQSNGKSFQRKPSVDFVEQQDNVNYHRSPTAGFTETSDNENYTRKPSAGFVEQCNNLNFLQKPTVGQSYEGKYPPNSSEDFSLQDTDTNYSSKPSHVVVQQSKSIPFPKVTSKEAVKKSSKISNAGKQSHDFFTQSNDVFSHRKPSGTNGRTHGRVTIHVDEDSRHEKKSSCTTCGDCCKKTFAFLVSHIGLCSLVVGYSIAGGFIFRELESPFEARERSNVALTRHKRVEELWNMTAELNVLFKENWTLEAEKVLLTFQMDVFRATKEKGWDGKDGDSNLQWSFAGALLYSVTVITTIGYGHIAPKTPNGRLVTIFYALLGIPLTLLCLANIGRMFSDCFRFTYKYTCRCLKWTFLPSKPVFKRRAERKRNSSTRKRAKRQMRELERAEELIFSIEDQKQALEDEEEVRVPIFISMGVMALYIFGGAVLFMLWEDDWDYLIGSYFCFITLSTIGFGDFVPGASVDSWANQEKTILCTLYLVFGLSLIAMCFNLMQEEVKLKFRWLGTKLNLIDDRRNKR